jgi:carbonic anhydrase
MHTHKDIDREKMTPKQVLDILISGNQRFINNAKYDYDLTKAREIIKEKQHPIAAVLGCSDSRTTLELIFNQSLGDIFSVRLAGNIASKQAIGSLEFSSKYLGSKIIVVMGHSNCGAIKAACDQYEGGNIGEVISFINPAVNAETSILEPNRNSNNNEFVEKVCFLNVQKQIETIVSNSEIISDLLKQQKIGIVGCVYNLASGLVEFDAKNFIFS